MDLKSDKRQDDETSNSAVKNVLVCAGEASGDAHGGNLVREMKKLAPVIRVIGIAGKNMRKAGVKALARVEDIAVMGFMEVLGKLWRLVCAFRKVSKAVDEQTPDLAVLIDAPDLNLRLAKKLRSKGVPIVYYISPQVWAWREGRVRKIRKLVDKMLVILPFEQEFYRARGMDARFVGHPLLDKPVPNRDETRSALDITRNAKVVSLVPGSRMSEVKRMLPRMLSAAYRIAEQCSDPVTFLVPVAPTIAEEDIEHMCAGVDLDLRILGGGAIQPLAASDAAIVASGTATLEAALAGIPMVIVYRTSWPSYLLARALVRGIEHIGLPNIILGRPVATELVQSAMKPARMSDEVLRLLSDRQAAQAQVVAWQELKKKLGGPGASERAAKEVLDLGTWTDRDSKTITG